MVGVLNPGATPEAFLRTFCETYGFLSKSSICEWTPPPCKSNPPLFMFFIITYIMCYYVHYSSIRYREDKHQ